MLKEPLATKGLEVGVLHPGGADCLVGEALHVLEDVQARQQPGGQARPAGLLDALIYLEADEADLERWYVDRFLELWEAAEHDPSSFYARFRHMTREQTDGLARMVWRDVNLKNLHDHIIHARARADLVVAKGPDHAIASLSGPAARNP